MSRPPDNDAADRNRTRSETPDQRIERAVTRLEAAVRRKPAFGHSTSTSTTTLIDGLRCVTREGDHHIITDLTAALGGQQSGPTPSAVLRAALGSCLAMGYRLRAARHAIPVDSIRVEVESESAIVGMLDPDSTVSPGFTDVRYRVDIDSPASAEQVEQLIEKGDRLSPVLDVVSRANRVTRIRSDLPTPSMGGER